MKLIKWEMKFCNTQNADEFLNDGWEPIGINSHGGVLLRRPVGFIERPDLTTEKKVQKESDYSVER